MNIITLRQRLIFMVLLLTAFAFFLPAKAVSRVSDIPPPVVLHPPFRVNFSCSYHPLGQLQALGDALGSDCFVTSLQVSGEGRGWSAPYRNTGAANEDWFGWNQAVLAPVDGAVVEVFDNPAENIPGVMQPGRAASITLRRSDGLHVVVAHVQSASVIPGQLVRSGEEIARIGNNGYSRAPHIHIGAYKDGIAYPIAFDLTQPVDFLVNGEVWDPG